MKNYTWHKIAIIEMQSENSPYGDPDSGCPEEALNDYFHFYPAGGEQCITKGEHNFIIWPGEEPGVYFANAWSFAEQDKTPREQQFTTYYELHVLNEKQIINIK